MLTNTFRTQFKETETTSTLLSGVKLYAKILEGPSQQGKTALFIHGGGSGGNHTIVYRPSKWLIDQGLFNCIILPDRRGAANSSPMTSPLTFRDHAQDLKELLDTLGIKDKVTAIGISYGGPIALTLAGIDPRIDEVVLIASSPSLKAAKGLVGFLYRKKLLDKIVAGVYKKLVGKQECKYPDFDDAYNSKNVGDLKKIFAEAIMHTPRERYDSLLYENASTCDLNNQAVAQDLCLPIPIYRIIGTRDETWEVDLGNTYEKRFKSITSVTIPGAGHKDVFFRASEFYEALKSIYPKSEA